MKKTAFLMVAIALILVSCSGKCKKQEVAATDSVAVAASVDTTAQQANQVVTEIDSTSKQVDELVNQL